jgi:hypothetical protein
MNQRVGLFNVQKGQLVSLSKRLPTGHSFGNNYPINEYARGYVTSEGFEAGKLKVKFDSHMYGTEDVAFNELSAKEYLLTDIY